MFCFFDPASDKLKNVAHYRGIHPVACSLSELNTQVMALTENRGVDLVFECSGAAGAFADVASYLRPGGTIICVGMPATAVELDIFALMVKEIRLVTVFRYANVYERAIALQASGKIDVKPMITATFPFDLAIEAFVRADRASTHDIKIQIIM